MTYWASTTFVPSKIIRLQAELAIRHRSIVRIALALLFLSSGNVFSTNGQRLAIATAMATKFPFYAPLSVAIFGTRDFQTSSFSSFQLLIDLPFVSSSTLSTISSCSRRNRNVDHKINVKSITRTAPFEIKRLRGGSQHHSKPQQHQWSHRSHSSEKNRRKGQQLDGGRKNQGNNNIIESSDGGSDNPNDERTKILPFFMLSPKKVSRTIRQGAGACFSVAGFIGSSLISFATDRRSFQDRFGEPIRALNNFLKTSG